MKDFLNLCNEMQPLIAEPEGSDMNDDHPVQPLISEPEGSTLGNMDVKKRTNSARGSDDLLHGAMKKGGGSSAQS